MGYLILLLVLFRPIIELFYNLEFGNIKGYNINVLSLWGGAILLLEVYYWIINKRDPFKYEIIKYILLFIFSLLLGAVFSTGINAIIDQIFKILTWILLIPIIIDFFVLKYNNSYILFYKGVDKLFKYFYFAILIFISINIIIYISGNYKSEYYKIGEYYSLYSGPHSFAFTNLFLIPYLLYFIYLKKDKTKKFISILLLFVIVIFLFLTFVRTGIVAFIFSYLILFYLNKNYKRKMILILILGSFTFLLFSEFYYVIENILNFRMIDFYEAFKKGKIQSLGSGRFAIWPAQLGYYINGSFMELMFGNGPGFIKFLTLKKAGIGVGGHNDYIDLLLSTGLFGFITYLNFQLYLLKKIYIIYKRKNMLLGQLGIFAFVSMFVSGMLNGIIYHQSNVYNAIIFGIVLSSYEIEKILNKK